MILHALVSENQDSKLELLKNACRELALAFPRVGAFNNDEIVSRGIALLNTQLKDKTDVVAILDTIIFNYKENKAASTLAKAFQNLSRASPDTLSPETGKQLASAIMTLHVTGSEVKQLSTVLRAIILLLQDILILTRNTDEYKAAIARAVLKNLGAKL